MKINKIKTNARTLNMTLTPMLLAALLHITIAQLLVLRRLDTSDRDLGFETLQLDFLVLDVQSSFGVSLLPKPPQTINLCLMQEKRI